MTIYDHLKKLFVVTRKGTSMPLDVRLLQYVIAYGTTAKPTHDFIVKCEAIERENIEQRKENKKRHDAIIAFFNELFLIVKTLSPTTTILTTSTTQAYQTPPTTLFTQTVTHYTHTLSRP